MLAHRGEATSLPVGLGEYTERVYRRIDRFALDLGADLQEVLDVFGRSVYERWVCEALPFGLDQARRLRMIHKAFATLPSETLARFPRPFQALYALARLPTPALLAAVESGAVTPELTVREATGLVRQLSGRETRRLSEADIVAGKLVGLPAESLSVTARGLLVNWLATAAVAV